MIKHPATGDIIYAVGGPVSGQQIAYLKEIRSVIGPFGVHQYVLLSLENPITHQQNYIYVDIQFAHAIAKKPYWTGYVDEYHLLYPEITESVTKKWSQNIRETLSSVVNAVFINN